MKKLYFALILILTMAEMAIGQSYSTSYESNAGNPNGLNSEGDAPGTGGWGVLHNGSQSSNAWSNAVNIPFNFIFFGEQVTQFKASLNGLVTFDVASSTLPDTNEALPSSLLPDNTIACWWDAFTSLAPTGSNDEVIYKTYGTAPNRQLWIKWYSFEMGSPSMSFAYFAVVLEESTNNIYLVDQYSSTSPTLSATVGIQKNASTAVTNGSSLTFSGNSSGNSDNDFYAYAPIQNFDAGLVQLQLPDAPICPGSMPISAVIYNGGSTSIDSVGVSYQINGGSPVAQTFTGLSLDSNEFDTLNLGSIVLAAGTLYNLDLYFTSINGAVDSVSANDTLSQSNIQTGLSGSYTLDPAASASATNFQSFQALSNALNSFGVCGAVTVDAASAMFSENVYLSEIGGMSATNTVTIVGEGPSNTILTHDGSLSAATLQLEGADHFTFKQMTIATTKTSSDGWAIHLSDTADFNTFDSCVISATQTSTSDISGLVTSSSLATETGNGNNANHTTVSNCTVLGGEDGINFNGSSSLANYNVGNSIVNCVFKHQDDQAINALYQDSLTIVGNTIDSLANSTADGIFLANINNVTMNENSVVATDYGIYVINLNVSATASSPSEFINNMSYSSNDYGMYFVGIEDLLMYHNTTSGKPGMRMNNQVNVDIRNNIFVGNVDYAFESDDAIASTDSLDFNIYGSNDATNIVLVNGSAYSSLSAWQSASPAYNANSIEGVPIFANATDLHVLDFLANNVGDSTLGVTLDIDGDARPEGPIVDIGADEFTPIANDVRAIAILSPQGTLCSDSTQMFEVVFYNGGLNGQSNIPVALNISGGFTASILDTLDTLVSFGYDTVMMGPQSTLAGGVLSLQLITNLVGDEFPSNDTAVATVEVIPFSALATAVNDTLCIGDSANLTATGGGYFYWYETESSSTLISTEDTFGIGGVMADTTLWVSNADMVNYSVGAKNLTIGANANSTTVSNYSLVFDVYQEITLDSVTVFAAGNGNVVVELLDSIGTTVLQSTSQAVVGAAAGEQISVGFVIAPGHYRLRAGAATNTGGLFRNSSGAEYPYTLPGSMSITATTFFNQDYYHFFYDWKVTGPGCESDRVPVTAIVDSIDIVLQNDTSLCPQDSTAISAGSYDGYLWSNGSNGSSIVVNTAGTYSVTVNNATGCEASDSVVVTVFDEPALTISNDTAICQGDSAQLEANSGFISYTWSNGASSNVTTVGVQGTYFVNIIDSNTCTASDTVVVSVNALPIVNVTEEVEVCDYPGANAQITAATGFSSYLWSNGDTTNVAVVASAGTYTVTATDANGCSNTATAVVEFLSLPEANLPADSGYCADFPLMWTIAATVGYDSYQWSTGDSSTFIFVDTAGSYAVTVTDSNNCISSDTTVVVEYPSPMIDAGPDTVICEGETIVLDPGTGDLLIEWTDSLGNVVTVATTPGWYYVLGTDSNGCSATDSLFIDECVGIAAVKNIDWRIYPNPASGLISVAAGISTDMQVDIFDLNGALVLKSRAFTNKMEINISGLAAGVYTVRLSTLEGQSHKRIIVQR